MQFIKLFQTLNFHQNWHINYTYFLLLHSFLYPALEKKRILFEDDRDHLQF
jgi:hypothetical protein